MCKKNTLLEIYMLIIFLTDSSKIKDKQADIIDKNGYQVPVFEVKVKKDVILYDQNKDLLEQENKVISVDGVNGSEIILGSMSEVSINGNWPSIFDAKNNQ